MALAADSDEYLDTYNLYLLANAACIELEKRQRLSSKTKKKRTALVAVATAVTKPEPPLKKLKSEFAEPIFSSVCAELKSLTLIKKEKKIVRDYNSIPKPGPPPLREAPVSLKQKIAELDGAEPILVAEKPLTDSDLKRNLGRLQKKKKIVRDYNPIAKPGPPPLREAPAILKQKIAEMDGKEPILVAEKPLTESDLKRNLGRLQKKKNIVRDYNPIAKPGPPPLREAPAILKQKIAEMDGKEPILVAEKPLTESDLKRNLGRLQIPESQMNKFLSDYESGFLMTKEKNKLNGIKASLHQYSGEGEYLGFSGLMVKRWPMNKPNGSPPAMMTVLTTGWNDVVTRNKLNAGDMVQVWAFRVLEELHLALLLV